MKFSKKISLIVFLIAISQMTIFAQNQEATKVNHTIHIGYPSLFFDQPERGIHIGYHPSLDLTKRFSIEGQVSYSMAKFEQDDDFFAHNGGEMQVFNLLGGTQFSFTKKERANQFYFNFLLGYAYVNESELTRDGDTRIRKSATLGYSSGLYFRTKRNISFGLAVETNEIAILKIGYQF